MMDHIDRVILRELLQNGRATLKQLAGAAGMSAPSTGERVRRLEEQGIIRGYVADVDPRLVGLTVEALVRIRPLPGRVQEVARLIEEAANVVSCDRVTGEDCFVVRIHARSLDDLDVVVEKIGQEAITVTSLVKGQAFRPRGPAL